MVGTRGRLLRRLVTLATIGGVLAYRRKRLDAADHELPDTLPRPR